MQKYIQTPTQQNQAQVIEMPFLEKEIPYLEKAHVHFIVECKMPGLTDCEVLDIEADMTNLLTLQAADRKFALENYERMFA